MDVETLAVFVGIPALILLLIGGPAYAFGGSKRPKRYRPGRPYDFAPVWFLSAPEQAAAASGAKELGAKPQPPALPAGEAPDGGRETGAAAVPQGSTGGASDRW